MKSENKLASKDSVPEFIPIIIRNESFPDGMFIFDNKLIDLLLSVTTIFNVPPE